MYIAEMRLSRKCHLLRRLRHDVSAADRGADCSVKTIDAQLRSRTESTQEFADGVNRFMIGLGKKVLLANNAGVLWDSIKVQDPSGIPTLTAWIGIAAYTFQIYYDFSGYSDMAIGSAICSGFVFWRTLNTRMSQRA